VLVTERALRFIAKSERLAGRVASAHFVRRSGLQTFMSAWGARRDSGYNPDSMARSNRKRISSSLLVSEITKRTCPWLEVPA
jgi:hypothetical protein